MTCLPRIPVAIRRSLLLAALAPPALGALGAGCSGGSAAQVDAADTAPPPVDGRLFTRLPASFSGVRFANTVEDTRELNVFTYRNFYNGGGVAVGDLTGDGLPEVVLTSNADGPRLYLNRGGLRFRDVTEASGIGAGRDSWTTGVVMADVNGDGRLDVYVCRAGSGEPKRRANALWINEGLTDDSVPRFTDRAAEYGVGDQGWSTHAAFLDHDRDGDLDLFVINNSPRPVTSFGMKNTRGVRHPYGGHKLYRNDGGKFVDVSAKAGIHGSEIAFGLGIAVGDVNRDGWPDVYVSNDFFERDYLYVNRGDGTFDESLDRRMPAVTYYSMGLDVADVDDDGWPEVYTTDMLPEDERRLKLTGMYDSWDTYQAKLRNGYHHQLMRNMLQRNNGDGTFSDVSFMAGVARTDWSWSALLVDLDLDGRKDIFVTNGIARDVTSQDYVAFLANEETMKAVTNGGKSKVDFVRLVKAMSSTPLPDYAFRNEGGLRFTNVARDWGLDTPSFSSGAAYGDLDGDGDPDLVVNNVNAEAFVYRNNARAIARERHALQVRLEGTGANRFGVGARVTVRAGADAFMQEQAPSRGFQSSVDYVLTFGLGARDTVDTLTVEWPDGRVSTLTRLAADQRVTVRQAEAAAAPPRTAVPPAPAAPTILAAIADTSALPFAHRENEFVDFDRERMIPKLLSTEGPAMAVADVDGDGLDDIYLGGAKQQAGRLLLQQPDGRFAPSNPGLFEADAMSEDVGAVFFDADGDRRPDLYVTSGGNEYSEGADPLQDRLYMNLGGGRFRKATDALPPETNSGSRPAAGDFDGDGDVDLFVGGRVVPWEYGRSPTSMLLRNDGRGRFTDVTAAVAPALAKVGMVTDATWADVDGDRRLDLVVVGEWMPITVFRNAGGRLAPHAVAGLERSHGWWNRVVAGDFTGDGRVDFVVGNLGTNSRLQATPGDPLTMYVKDFDRNGFLDQVIATSTGGRQYPFLLRDDMVKALPFLKARNLKHEQYAGRTIPELFTAPELEGAEVRSAYTFATSLVRNDGKGGFTLEPLPMEAQVAPVYGILAGDFDGDARTDLLLAGNFDGVKPDVGRMAGSFGVLLAGDGAGRFRAIPSTASGFRVPGETRDLRRVRTRAGALVVAARNDERPLAFTVRGKAPATARPRLSADTAGTIALQQRPPMPAPRRN